MLRTTIARWPPGSAAPTRSPCCRSTPRSACRTRSPGGSPATPRRSCWRSRTWPGSIDPAGGSWYVEPLTDELAARRLGVLPGDRAGRRPGRRAALRPGRRPARRHLGGSAARTWPTAREPDHRRQRVPEPGREARSDARARARRRRRAADCRRVRPRRGVRGAARPARTRHLAATGDPAHRSSSPRSARPPRTPRGRRSPRTCSRPAASSPSTNRAPVDAPTAAAAFTAAEPGSRASAPATRCYAEQADDRRRGAAAAGADAGLPRRDARRAVRAGSTATSSPAATPSPSSPPPSTAWEWRDADIPDFSGTSSLDGPGEPRGRLRGPVARRRRRSRPAAPTTDLVWETPGGHRGQAALHPARPGRVWTSCETYPGIAPYLRGPYPTMYVNQPWTIRQYAGLLHRRGVQRLLPAQPRGRAEGPVGRLRPAHPPRLRLRPPAGDRRRRHGRRRDRLDLRHAAALRRHPAGQDDACR